MNTLLDRRSVTRTVQRLSLIQPVVSGMLSRLHDYFDSPLSSRTPYGIVPTLRAQQLAAPIRQIPGGIGILLRLTQFDPLIAAPISTVAATDYAFRAVVVPLIAMLRARASGIRVRVISIESVLLTTQFGQGKINLTLLTPDPTPDDLHSRALYDEGYVCLTRCARPGTGQPLTLGRFYALKYVLTPYEGESFWGITDKVLAGIGRQRQTGLPVSSFLILPDILAANDVIAAAPACLTYGNPRIHVLSSPLPIAGFTKNMTWHKYTYHGATCQWLRDLVYETSRLRV